MSILAQCGFGRGNKIEQGLDSSVIDGVIMSPRDESRERLELAINQWRQIYPNSILLFDPQFYAATLNTPRDGHLSEYDYYSNNNGLSRTHFSGKRIHSYVKECLDYQHYALNNNLTYLISPTILFDSFRDFWSQVALNMAVESAEYHLSKLRDARPLLLSIVVSETAFQTMDAMDEFLDALTELDVAGFYLIIRRNANSLQNSVESASFSRFLYFCHVLAAINEYKVIVGYSDWHSFLVKAMDVTHTACGWYQNLRQFSLARYQPSTGGRRPRKRYSSPALLSNPLITPELQDIYLAGLLPTILSGSPHDSIIKNDPATGEVNWSEEVSCLTHWFSLNDISQRISRQPNALSRIQEVEQIIHDAMNLYRQLESNGVSFDPQTGPRHIVDWQDAVQEFRGLLGM